MYKKLQSKYKVNIHQYTIYSNFSRTKSSTSQNGNLAFVVVPLYDVGVGSCSCSLLTWSTTLHPTTWQVEARTTQKKQIWKKEENQGSQEKKWKHTTRKAMFSIFFGKVLSRLDSVRFFRHINRYALHGIYRDPSTYVTGILRNKMQQHHADVSSI